ncbi:hypothetical protein PM082_022047 [Marasmius tenuissimus]|nr:hypothetical protein PM082_022047 [Marasmius tenuissimus]
MPNDRMPKLDTALLTIMVGSTLYGIYMILYVLCMYILFTQKRGRYWVHCILITAIYVAATIQFGLRYAVYLMESLEYHGYESIYNMGPRNVQMELAISVLTIIANCMADILLLWRCYLIWDHKLRVVIVPLLLCLGTNAFGFLQAIYYNHYFDRAQSLALLFAIFGFCAITSNLLLTILLAGRICFIVNRVMRYLPPSSRKRYKTVISASLESGLLYPMVLLIYALPIVLQRTDSQSDSGSTYNWDTLTRVSSVTFDSLINVMGIASALIIVRVSLGIAIHDEKTFKETILRNQEPSMNGPGVKAVNDLRREPCGCEQSRREAGESDLESQNQERKGL